jgi:hypothetical protein
MQKRYYRKNESGAVSGSLISLVLLGVALVACIGLAIWLFVQYSDQKSNVDARVDAAVAEAVRNTQENEQEKFLEREKEPNLQFAGPDDYGRLTFDYSKTWSVYVNSDASGEGNYEAYFHPVIVPSVDAEESRYALRVVIENEAYDEIIASYSGSIEDGELKSSTVSANGHRGTRLDGTFTEDIRGSAVFFKLRDKTISLFTDADTFKPDFDKIIKTVDFND